MSKMKYRIVFLIIVLTTSLRSSGLVIETYSTYDCKVDDIYYTLNSSKKTAEVSYYKATWYNGSITGVVSYYSGTIEVPETITYNSVTYTVTGIRDYACSGCDELEGITLPNSIVSIGTNAFYECESLESLTIPDGVESLSLGTYAFYGCKSLTKISLPEGLESIPYAAFYGCTSLTDLNVPSTVKSIGKYAFYKCTKLNDISIPNGVESIQSYTFAYCSSLTTLTLPSSLTSIDKSAFNGCTGLTELYINFDINNLDVGESFTYLTNLAHVTLNENTCKIPDSAFSGHTALESVSFQNNVISIGPYAFYNCSSLSSIGSTDSLISIGSYAFSGCSCLGEITLGEKLDSIGTYAFRGCTGLTSVTLSEGLASIGSSAFYGCKGLTGVTIPSSVTELADSVFYGCIGLTSVNLSEGLSSIGSYAFYGDTCLTIITIPSSVSSIGKYAFYGNTGLTSLSLSEGLSSIGSYAFYGCTGLTNVTIPSSITSFGSYAFYGCTGLASATLSEGLTSIGSCAFYDCTGLTSITIPSSITSFGAYAFYGCTGLTSVTLSEGLTSIGSYAFYGCTGLTGITIPSSITSFGIYAFYGCTGLTSATLSEGLTSIGMYAFYNCGLSSIDLPKSISSIGTNAISGTLTPLRLHYDASYNTSSIYKVLFNSVSDSSLVYAPRKYHNTIGTYFSGEIRDVDIQYIPTYSKYINGLKINLEDNEYWEGVYTLSRVLVNDIEVTCDDGVYFATGLAGSSATVQLVYSDANGDEITDQETVSLATAEFSYTSSVTQTTATFNVNVGEDETATASYVKVNGQTFDVADGVATVTFTNLKPATDYSYSVYVYYDETESSRVVGTVKATTKSVTWALKNYATTASSFSCDLKYTLGDAVIDTVYTSLDSKGEVSIDVEGADLSITGLLPATSYTVYVYGTLTVGSTYSASYTFKTSDLELTTEQPKVLSSTSALISATTNVDESETNVGFEWRKTDSPDEVASKSATAEIYDGELSGVIKNLSESTYYKYRAYYTSYIGTTYYGDWVGIDTDDYSYFEPTVKTGDVEVSDSYVTAKGYALQGTEDIEDQGFEYWVSSSSAKSSRVSSKASDDGVTRVTVDGQKMTATLTDLLSGTTYEIRAYATTTSGTTYGETVQFTTAEATGISNVTASGSEGLELLVRQSDGVQIAVSGGQKNECNYRIFSMTGSMVASGKVATDGNWYTIADANTLKGVYVIMATNGSDTKTKKLYVK